MRKPRGGFGATAIVMILFAILAIACAGWLVYQQRSEPKDIKVVLSRLTADTKEAFTNAELKPVDAWNAEASATAFNKVNGYDYAVSGAGEAVRLVEYPNGYQPVTINRAGTKDTIPAGQVLDEVKVFVSGRLKAYGFATDDSKTYKYGGVTCTVIDSTDDDIVQPPSLLEVRCFTGDELRAAADKFKPFVDEYLKANTSLKADDLAVGPLTIKSKNGAGVISSSNAVGYDIAEMVVSTKTKKQIILYYATGANIETGKVDGWHYVTQGDDEYGFRCGPIQANSQARIALNDQVCLSEKGHVRLDTTNRALQ